MANKTLVFGGTGFIGSQILKSCTQSTLVSRKDYDLLKGGSFPFDVNEETTIIYAAGIPRSRSNELEDKNNNIAMIKNLVEALKGKELKQFIFLSSVEVYGNDPQLPIHENTTLIPHNLYGEGKIECENILKDEFSELSILRLPGIYGKESSGGFLSLLSKKIKAKEKFTLLNNGETLRDFVFVGDLARLICEVVSKNSVGLLNIATGSSISLKEFVKPLEDRLGKGDVHYSHENEGEFDLVFNTENLKKNFPNFNFTKFESNLEELI